MGDRHERVYFAQEIVAPCLSNNQACGFSRNPNDSDHFTKKITNLGGKEVLIHLRLLHSSVSADDERNQKDRFQKWHSQRVDNQFRQGLKSADVVFYNGHSRNGGGPDFFPPLLTADGHIDYTFYEKETPGLKEIVTSITLDGKTDFGALVVKTPLADAETPRPAKNLKLLGLFSCASTKHFSDKIKEARPDLALITSQQLIYYVDALKNSLSAVNALLDFQCEKDFRKSLRSSSYQLGSQLNNFFVSRKPQRKD